jgi:hypothetical protein
MEIDNISDSDRITANADVLSTVESEIGSLEQMFAGLESLEAEKDRLSAVVRNLTEEESRILQDDAAEPVIVKKLLTTRGARDVQASRLSSVQDRINNAQTDLATQGANVRRAFAVVITQLLTARQARALAILQGLFGGPIRPRIGRTELKELVHHVVWVKEAKTTWNKFALQTSDPAQETAAWRRTREWLAETKNLVENEPGLTLKGLPTKQPQPVENPAAEMATA